MLATFEKAALEAGQAILEVYRAGYAVALKQDMSPVTLADEKAERIILRHLERDFPHIPAIAEEQVSAGQIPDVRGRAFFLVDPLDGTREFIEHRDEFTVNIAYVENGIPVTGIVYAPALGIAFTGEPGRARKLIVDEHFAVSDRLTIAVRERPAKLTALASRCNSNARTEDFLTDNAVSACTSIGSSLKFCLLAEGKADVYPRFGRTMEWDTAAGDAVLRAAGGTTVTVAGSLLTYGKTDQNEDADFANPHFICWGGQKHGVSA
ncbi:3'(2'),5'-bisphosphate nucleotidase CysQ [Rhizobium sp. P40RR-XXII]|uniref:3'(2'),5'-bisphosphate nucleotidase CysQ n=1 Tax=unclassified Rhizobium TaxID=2613769 RepID=UPI0014571F6F|nr:MULTISPECIES: 3'(2'),5'-bisphosphate nucleotidase CysQ [unclassified Rhizobium]NLR83993.1 3'(2'),5'-bisphosphate nucleotidase CysQ [Rhizobium sp. P28RR-XV]NLS15361.1 3'(2'),5'-bisphosphate nucleotidase CysQ [Rhizobium sp. P40RR-XXII]